MDRKLYFACYECEFCDGEIDRCLLTSMDNMPDWCPDNEEYQKFNKEYENS